LESGKRGKDGTANPDRVFSLWRSNDLDLHGSRSKSLDFLGHTFGDTGEHSSTTRKNDVTVQVLSDIDVTLHDGVISGGVDTFGFLTNQRWLEENFWASEAFASDSDNLSIRKLIALFTLR
jgi:hypothetical protein